MNSFLHHKFYTTHRTVIKTVAIIIMYAEAIKHRTKNDDFMCKTMAKNLPGLICGYVKLNNDCKITHLA